MTSLSDLARKAGFDVATNGRGVQIVVDSDGIEITDQLERLLALHVQELCAGVEPVGESLVGPDGEHHSFSKEIGYLRPHPADAEIGYTVKKIYPASTVAALQARVAELQKISDEYMSLIRHMDAGGDFYEFQMKVTEALWSKK